MEKVSLQDGDKLSIRSSSPFTSRFPPIIIPTLIQLPEPVSYSLVSDDKLTFAKMLVTYYFPFLLETSSSVNEINWIYI